MRLSWVRRVVENVIISVITLDSLLTSLKILKQFTLHPAAEEFSVGESWFYCDDPLSIGD